MSQKELVLEAIRDLPDDASIDLIAGVQKGLTDIDRGMVVPHNEVKGQLAAWLSA